jgi:hypothetical protein
MTALVVRVAAAAPPGEAPPPPRRLRLGLSELVLAARLAGEVPLPLRADGHPAPDRLTERLAGSPLTSAHERLDEELARVDDAGPSGARAALVSRGAVDGAAGVLDPALRAAIENLAGAPLSVVLDVAVARRAGEVRLRTWIGVRRGLATQLTTGSGLEVELAWFDPRLWVSQLTRVVTAEPWVPDPAPLVLPDFVSLPSELLAGTEQAHRDQRTDLLPALAAAHVGRVRLGEPRAVRDADSEEIHALLATLGGACRGRLRLLTGRRDRPADPPGVTTWLMFDDGWHELRPGRDATSVLRRRDARDLGLLTWPLVEGVPS